jgi:hypothetical protein
MYRQSMYAKFCLNDLIIKDLKIFKKWKFGRNAKYEIRFIQRSNKDNLLYNIWSFTACIDKLNKKTFYHWDFIKEFPCFFL